MLDSSSVPNIVAVGWLALLAGTCHIDLGELPAAVARIRSADDIAREAEHPEISAWCLETRAWQQLIHSDFVSAAELSRGAQALAPAHSSAFIQATAQEGRANARLGDHAATYRALGVISRLVSGLHTPDRPEHHYHYDPAKSDAYMATTLAWLGDSAAESYARHVLADRTSDTVIRPRRIAMAHLDLGLSLVAADKPDEAADAALEAITSGRLVRSHYWRVAEVAHGIAERDSARADSQHVSFSGAFCTTEISTNIHELGCFILGTRRIGRQLRHPTVVRLEIGGVCAQSAGGS